MERKPKTYCPRKFQWKPLEMDNSDEEEEEEAVPSPANRVIFSFEVEPQKKCQETTFKSWDWKRRASKSSKVQDEEVIENEGERQDEIVPQKVEQERPNKDMIHSRKTRLESHLNMQSVVGSKDESVQQQFRDGATIKDNGRYEIKKITSPTNKKNFSQMIFLGESRFTLDRYLAENMGCDIQVFSELKLTLSGIESAIKKHKVDCQKSTLLLCSIGINDFLQKDYGDEVQHPNFELMIKKVRESFPIESLLRKAKLVRKKLMQIFTKNSEVYFFYVLPVDLKFMFGKNGIADIHEKDIKLLNQQCYYRIKAFNNYLKFSIPRKLRKRVDDFFPSNFEESVRFVEANMMDGVSLKKNAVRRLSAVIVHNLRSYSTFQGRYENVVLVGDSQLESVARVWPGDRFNCTMLIDSNFRLSNIKPGDPLVKELSEYKNSLIVVNLGIGDLYTQRIFSCHTCKKKLEILVPNSFDVVKLDLLTQIMVSLKNVEIALKKSLDNCKVTFALAHPIDVLTRQKYVIENHSTTCKYDGYKLFLNPSVEQVTSKLKDMLVVVQSYNRLSMQYCEKNKLPLWDRLPHIYGQDYKIDHLPLTIPADTFIDGFNLTRTAACGIAKYFHSLAEDILELELSNTFVEETSIQTFVSKFLKFGIEDNCEKANEGYAKSGSPRGVVGNDGSDKVVTPTLGKVKGTKRNVNVGKTNFHSQGSTAAVIQHPVHNPPFHQKVWFQPSGPFHPETWNPYSFPCQPAVQHFPNFNPPPPLYPPPMNHDPHHYYAALSSYDGYCTPEMVPPVAVHEGMPVNPSAQQAPWVWQASTHNNPSMPPGNFLPSQGQGSSSCLSSITDPLGESSSKNSSFSPWHRKSHSLLSKVSRSKSPSLFSSRMDKKSTDLSKLEEKALMTLRKVHNRECETYKKMPKAHPDYHKEHHIFMTTYVRRVLDSGGKPDMYCLEKDWEEYWDSRLVQLLEESWVTKRDECLAALKHDPKNSSLLSDNFASNSSRSSSSSCDSDDSRASHSVHRFLSSKRTKRKWSRSSSSSSSSTDSRKKKGVGSRRASKSPIPRTRKFSRSSPVEFKEKGYLGKGKDWSRSPHTKKREFSPDDISVCQTRRRSEDESYIPRGKKGGNFYSELGSGVKHDSNIYMSEDSIMSEVGQDFESTGNMSSFSKKRSSAAVKNVKLSENVAHLHSHPSSNAAICKIEEQFLNCIQELSRQRKGSQSSGDKEADKSEFLEDIVPEHPVRSQIKCKSDLEALKRGQFVSGSTSQKSSVADHYISKIGSGDRANAVCYFEPDRERNQTYQSTYPPALVLSECKRKPQNEILEVLEVVSQFSDALGNLKLPLKVLYEKALNLHSAGLNVATMFRDNDNMTLIFLISSKLKKTKSSPQLSIIQKVIIEEVLGRLDGLMEKAPELDIKGIAFDCL